MCSCSVKVCMINLFIHSFFCIHPPYLVADSSWHLRNFSVSQLRRCAFCVPRQHVPANDQRGAGVSQPGWRGCQSVQHDGHPETGCWQLVWGCEWLCLCWHPPACAGRAVETHPPCRLGWVEKPPGRQWLKTACPLGESCFCDHQGRNQCNAGFMLTDNFWYFTG